MVDYHPLVPVIPPTREHAALAGRQSVDLGDGTPGTYDAVLIATDDDAIDYKVLVAGARLVIDTLNACERNGALAEHVVKA